MLGVPVFLEDRAMVEGAIQSFLDPLVDVVVVDNGATEEAKAGIATFHGDVEVIRNPTNVYVNPALNQIAERFLRSNAKILVLANADVRVRPGWAESLLARRERDSNELWFGRRTWNVEETKRPRSHCYNDVLSDNPSRGAFFAMTHKAVPICFPIPQPLRMWFGDNWIFETLLRNRYRQVTLTDVVVWHEESVSQKRMPQQELYSVIQQDREAWAKLHQARPIMLGVPVFREDKTMVEGAIQSFLDPLVNVVVVDNGASEDAKAGIATFQDAVEIIRNQENIYVNPAWNQLAKRFLSSDAEILVIANADILVRSGWAESILARHNFDTDEIWFGHRTHDVQETTGLRQYSSKETTKQPSSRGGFFAMKRKAVPTVFPIPSELRIFYGDNWIFDVLAMGGYREVTLADVVVWHEESVSRKRLPEVDDIFRQDRHEWDTHLCHRARHADVAMRNKHFDAVETRYMSLRDTASDFNEHMPILRSYAERVKLVTEFGAGRSSWALLYAHPQRLRCYDINPRRTEILDLVSLGHAIGIDVDFVVGNTLEIEIEPTDLLFIDSLHTYTHLTQELDRHASKVSHYILLHDTETFGQMGEDGKQPGLMGAVEDFLAKDTRWRMCDRLKNNNGLTILERVESVNQVDVLERIGSTTGDLVQLFTKYGTDKLINRYAPLYHAILHNRRDGIRSLLEVGIGTMLPGVHSSMVGYAQDGYAPGGSLRAWRDYLPNATITGIDVQPDTQVTEDRIETLLCDSTNESQARNVLGERRFDVIIDDGSHIDTNQLLTLRHLYPRLNPGGVYVIEDIYRGSRLTDSPFDVAQIIGHDGLFFVGREANMCVICAPVNGRYTFPIMNTPY